MIFVCKLPINKIKGSPDNGPDKDSIENKMPFILYLLCRGRKHYKQINFYFIIIT
jgi:hypothetical protein